jgi:DNA-binding MarR family transcriptional regulator
MNQQPSIVPLVEQWEAFVKAKAGTTVDDFAKWVLEKEKTENKTAITTTPFFDPLLKEAQLQGDYPAIPTSQGLAVHIVIRLFKAIRFYFKPTLQRHGFKSLEEFLFLATLSWKDNISKKTLCRTNMTDIPTGIDIIKRLIQQGLVDELENPGDKREKLLSATALGKQKLFQLFADPEETADVMADMKTEERLVFMRMIDRLNNFHTKVYHQQVDDR